MIAKTDDKIMNKAVFVLEKMSADEKMREVARVRERALHDEASYIEDAMNKGRKEGWNEGRKEGMAIGEKKGMDKGRADILRQLFAAGAIDKGTFDRFSK